MFSILLEVPATPSSTIPADPNVLLPIPAGGWLFAQAEDWVELEGEENRTKYFCRRCGKEAGPYNSELSRKVAMRQHRKVYCKRGTTASTPKTPRIPKTPKSPKPQRDWSSSYSYSSSRLSSTRTRRTASRSSLDVSEIFPDGHAYVPLYPEPPRLPPVQFHSCWNCPSTVPYFEGLSCLQVCSSCWALSVFCTAQCWRCNGILSFVAGKSKLTCKLCDADNFIVDAAMFQKQNELSRASALPSLGKRIRADSTTTEVQIKKSKVTQPENKIGRPKKDPKDEKSGDLSYRQRLFRTFNQLRHAKQRGRRRADIFFQLPQRDKYPSYYEVISNPITLGDVRENIRMGSYEGQLDKYKDDFLRVFKNAQLYNEPGSQVYEDAVHLQGMFLRQFKELRKEYGHKHCKDNLLTPKVPGKKEKGEDSKSVADGDSDVDMMSLSETSDSSRALQTMEEDTDFDPATMDGDDDDWERQQKNKYKKKKKGKKARSDSAPTVSQERSPASSSSTAAVKQKMRKERRKEQRREKRQLKQKTFNEIANKLERDGDAETVKSMSEEEKYKWIYNEVFFVKTEDGDNRAALFISLPLKKDYPDYYQQSFVPIAMSTIKKRIKRGTYKDRPSKFLEQFQKVFQNAKEYNREGSQIYVDADELEKVVVAKYTIAFGKRKPATLQKTSSQTLVKTNDQKRKRSGSSKSRSGSEVDTQSNVVEEASAVTPRSRKTNKGRDGRAEGVEAVSLQQDAENEKKKKKKRRTEPIKTRTESIKAEAEIDKGGAASPSPLTLQLNHAGAADVGSTSASPLHRSKKSKATITKLNTLFKSVVDKMMTCTDRYGRVRWCVILYTMFMHSN